MAEVYSENLFEISLWEVSLNCARKVRLRQLYIKIHEASLVKCRKKSNSSEFFCVAP